MKKITDLGLAPREVETAIARGMKFGPDSWGWMHARMGGIEVVYGRIAGDMTRVVTVFPAGREP